VGVLADDEVREQADFLPDCRRWKNVDIGASSS